AVRSRSPSDGSASSEDTSGRITIGSFDAAGEAGASKGELTLTGGGLSAAVEGRGGAIDSRTSSEKGSSSRGSSSSISDGGGGPSSARGGATSSAFLGAGSIRRIV